MRAIGNAWSVKVKTANNKWSGGLPYNYGLTLDVSEAKPNYTVPAIYHVSLDESFVGVEGMLAYCVFRLTDYGKRLNRTF